jgi:integrase
VVEIRLSPSRIRGPRARVIAGADFNKLLARLGELLAVRWSAIDLAVVTLPRNLLQQVLTPAAKDVGLGRVTWHRLRHACSRF